MHVTRRKLGIPVTSLAIFDHAHASGGLLDHSLPDRNLPATPQIHSSVRAINISLEEGFIGAGFILGTAHWWLHKELAPSVRHAAL